MSTACLRAGTDLEINASAQTALRTATCPSGKNNSSAGDAARLFSVSFMGKREETGAANQTENVSRRFRNEVQGRIFQIDKEG